MGAFLRGASLFFAGEAVKAGCFGEKISERIASRDKARLVSKCPASFLPPARFAPASQRHVESALAAFQSLAP